MKLTPGYGFFKSADWRGELLHIGALREEKTLCGSNARSPYPYAHKSTKRTCADCRAAYKRMKEMEVLSATGHVNEDGRLVF
jgi:hypothetical protein